MQKKYLFFSLELQFFLSKNAAQALQKRRRRLEMVPQFKILKNIHNTLSFQEKNYLQKIKIVLAKNKKVLANTKKHLFLSRTFFYFSAQKRAAGVPAAQRRSKMTPKLKLLKNMHKLLIFQEKKYLQKIKIVLAKNKK